MFALSVQQTTDSLEFADSFREKLPVVAFWRRRSVTSALSVQGQREAFDISQITFPWR
jgi:hypothetical protein